MNALLGVEVVGVWAVFGQHERKRLIQWKWFWQSQPTFSRVFHVTADDVVNDQIDLQSKNFLKEEFQLNNLYLLQDKHRFDK